jgi:hypothetical protein
MLAHGRRPQPLAPTLINLSSKLISDHGSLPWAYHHCPHEITVVIGERVKLEADDQRAERSDLMDAAIMPLRSARQTAPLHLLPKPRLS